MPVEGVEGGLLTGVQLAVARTSTCRGIPTELDDGPSQLWPPGAAPPIHPAEGLGTPWPLRTTLNHPPGRLES